MGLILDAAKLAEIAHEGQVRKYTDKPYITHPARVAAKMMLHPLATDESVAACWLHDFLEDCLGEDRPQANLLFEKYVSLQERYGDSGKEMGKIVTLLTNPSKKHPELKRHEKKKLDREHLQSQPNIVKVIKLIDRIDNLKELTGEDPFFEKKYGLESQLLLNEALTGVDDSLEKELKDTIESILRDIADREARQISRHLSPNIELRYWMK